MEPNDFSFPMGARVKDVVSGIEGIVTGRSQWLTGCNTIGIHSGLDKDGNAKDLYWVDENRCEVIDPLPIELPGEPQTRDQAARADRDRGGPQPTPSEGHDS